MKHNWFTYAAIATLAFAATSSRAQDEQPAKDEDVKAEKTNELTLGYSSFRTNENIDYYARPFEGLAIQTLRLVRPLTEDSTVPYARLVWKGQPEQDSVQDLFLALNNGRTVLRGLRQRRNFYRFDWRPKDDSQDDSTELTLDHSITPSFGGFVKYRESRNDARYSAPRDPEHLYSRLASGGVGGSVLGGNLQVALHDKRAFDDTGKRPETLQRGVSASYSRDFGSAFSLEGAAGYTKIEQAGSPSSGIRSYAFNGIWDLAPATSLQFGLARQDSDTDSIQNAFARQRFLTFARLVQRWPNWSLQFGYKHKETERVRRDQLFADVPKVDEYDARLAGRVGKARVTFRGNWQDLRSAATMQTLDARQLQWDDRVMFQAKVDCANDVFSTYTAYTYRFHQNKARGVDIGWQNFAIGGTWVVDPMVSAYAEFSFDDFRANGEFESNQDLDFYFPNSRNMALGFNWAPNGLMSASAGLNAYESGDVRGTQVTMSLRRQIAPDHTVELVVAPWSQVDRQFDLTGYNTTFLIVKYSVKF